MAENTDHTLEIYTPSFGMQTDLAFALESIADRLPRYAMAERYYRGDHRLAFATDKFSNAFGGLFKELADNLCPAVVDAVADKLEIQDFGTEDGNVSDAKHAWECWQENRMDKRAGMVHTEALKTGDGFVIVWPGADGKARIMPQRATQMHVYYDPDDIDVIVYAVKIWVAIDGFLRLTAYYPDRIEKYVSKNKITGLGDVSGLAAKVQSSLLPYKVPNEPWPLPNPYGRVPVFHFPNNAQMEPYGVSELASVIPMQDALNKTIADMLVSMEFVAFPQRWVTGLELELDPETRKPILPFKPGPDRVWSAEDGDVKFGQFDAADLSQFISVQDSLRAEVGRVSGTPLHYLMLDRGGDWPSGEAIKTAEERYIAKVRDRQVTFGNAWEDVLRFALLIEREASDADLATGWRDPAPRSEKEHVETLIGKTQLGVSKRQALKELGYGDRDIEDMLAEGDAQAAHALEQSMQAFQDGKVGGFQAGQ